MKILRWRKLLFNVKHWIVLGGVGVAIFLYGIVAFFYGVDIPWRNDRVLSTSLMAIGIILIGVAGNGGIKSIVRIICSFNNYRVFDSNAVNEILHREQVLSKGPRIVVLGGGTGLSVLLRGLKKYTSNITAIVTVADDGGGSGVLREELGMLPPGDIRNCILALADTEPTMEKVLRYRFQEGSLKGQSFGNLFIAAMNDIYGDFNKAIKEMGNVLAVKGKVLPMTIENIKLIAELEDGTVVEGESEIPEKNRELGGRIKRIYIDHENPEPLEESLVEIRNADCIVLGPGSLYTSVIPNLLVRGIVSEIKDSRASKVYIGNIMTQPGETDGYSLYDHIESIVDHSSSGIIDYVVANIGEIPEEMMKKYSEDGSEQVRISRDDEKRIKKDGIVLIKDNLIESDKESIRHDSVTLSQLIAKIGLANKLK